MLWPAWHAHERPPGVQRAAAPDSSRDRLLEALRSSCSSLASSLSAMRLKGDPLPLLPLLCARCGARAAPSAKALVPALALLLVAGTALLPSRAGGPRAFLAGLAVRAASGPS